MESRRTITDLCNTTPLTIFNPPPPRIINKKILERMEKVKPKNRLLENMRNKIDTLHDAIKIVNQLQRGETIHLGGFLNRSFGASKDATTEDFETAREKLRTEIDNLQNRVYRMCGEYHY